VTYDYNNFQHTNSRSPIILICNKCGLEFESKPCVISTKRSKGCPNCDRTERFQLFVKRSIDKHDNKYDYSAVEYINHSIKVEIICPIHGIFKQTPNNHVAGNGCPKCSISNFKKPKISNHEFISICMNKYGDTYDYSNTIYLGSKEDIRVKCHKHGEFIVKAGKHLSGTRCGKCMSEELEILYKKCSKSGDTFISEAISKHGDKYDYSKCKYINAKTDVVIICPMHGEFLQKPSVHLKSLYGCPKCASEKKKLLYNNDEFIKLSNEIHNNKYDYSKCEYNGIKNDITVICPKHGEFSQRAENHLNGMGCRDCSKIISNGQQSVVEFIKSIKNDIRIVDNYRDLDDIGEYEVDIWLPEYRIGIEYHGSYWHSSNDRMSDKRMFNLHRNKAKQSVIKNFKLFQIYDFEFGDIWKSMISNAIGVSNKVGARKLDIIGMNTKDERKFYELNHLQGYVSSTICYGLRGDDEVLCSMSFIKRKDFWEIQRFANLIGYSVTGGASRLFKHFLYENFPISVKTFADRRYSTGELYKNLGFKLIETTRPNYKYVNATATKVFSRQKCQKHKLKALLGDVFDPEISEAQNMFKAGYRRLWDAGNLKFKFEK
jgi:hypothetical protein